MTQTKATTLGSDLHHPVPDEATTTGADRGQASTAGVSRLVTDIRDASLLALLRASIRLAQQKKGAA